ncbi:MAG: DJ-1/PfpI/YhbO family deglycase/protease [Candidatus Caldatribacteriaceae bacterium]
MVRRKVMILVENQYQELELWYPLLRLREEGIEARLVGQSTEETFLGRHGFPAKVEVVTSSVSSRDFDGVIIPGGFAPDYLRRFPVVLNLVRELYQQNKLIGALSRAPWVLISADIIRGKRVTGLFSVKDDVNNAGGEFVNLPVVVDGNVITAQGPEDLPLFMKEVLFFLWHDRIRVGEFCPDGWLADTSGNSVSLWRILSDKSGVLLFFDSVSSPRSEQFLPSYGKLSEEIEKKGGVFLGISTDSFFVQQDFANRFSLSFPLWSDSSLELTKAFGVLGKNSLAEWAVFIVDRNKIIRYGESCPTGEIESLPGFRKKMENIFG